MNVKRWNLVCALGLLLATTLACSFSFSTANLSSLKISKDEAGNNAAGSFAPNEKVYALAVVSNAPGKLKLKGRVLADTVAGYTSGSIMPGAETTIDLPGSATGTFTFTPPATGWPNGSYKIEVQMINEQGEQKDQKTETFSVSGNTAAKPTAPAAPPAGTENDTVSGDNSMTGTWTLTGEGMTGESPLKIGPWQLTLDENGTELTGEMDGGDGTTANVSGTRSGNNLTLTWGAGAAKFALTGALDARGNLSGDFTMGGGARGKWQAVKSS